jgi:hypothetical protein
MLSLSLYSLCSIISLLVLSDEICVYVYRSALIIFPLSEHESLFLVHVEYFALHVGQFLRHHGELLRLAAIVRVINDHLPETLYECLLVNCECLFGRVLSRNFANFKYIFIQIG